MTFDPIAPEHQVTPEFGPDKTGSWPFPPEKDGWMLAHNALRGELKILKKNIMALAKKDKVKDWMIVSIQKMWEVHTIHIHSHHTNEDEILAPKLNERFKYPEKHVENHVGLVKALVKVDELMKSLKPDSASAELQKINQAFDDYTEIMLPHLREEEEIGLILTRAYFTPKEIGAVVAEIMKKAPPVELGGFIYFEGIENFRKSFMPQEGIPFFVWYLQFKSCHATFVRDFIRHDEAIKSGVAPESKEKSNNGLFSLWCSL